MSEGELIDLTRQVLITVLKSAAPLLLVSLIIGLIISIFQTVTSIQEQTLTFVPKLLSIFLVLILAGSWIMGNIVDLFISIMNNMGLYIR